MSFPPRPPMMGDMMGQPSGYQFQPMSMVPVRVDMMQPQAIPSSYGRVAFPGVESSMDMPTSKSPHLNLHQPSYGRVAFPGAEPQMDHRWPRSIADQNAVDQQHILDQQELDQQDLQNNFEDQLPIPIAQNDPSVVNEIVKSSLIQLCNNQFTFKEYVHIYGELKFRVDSNESHSVLFDENISLVKENPEKLALRTKRGAATICDDEDLPDKLSMRNGGKDKKGSATKVTKHFGCAICGKSFLNRSYAESHIAAHIKDRTIANNIVFHHGELPLKCKTCGEGFDEIKLLKKHLKTHPREKKARKQKKKIESPDDEDIPDENDLENDYETNDESENEEDEESDDPNVKCWARRSARKSTKKKKGKSKKKNDAAAKPKNKPFGCRICAKKFLTKQYLRKHIAKHKGVETPVEENIIYFKGESPYKCKLASCELAFDTISKRKNHMLTHGSGGGKTHRCYYCNKAFSMPGVLRRHMLIHDPAGVKSHKCPVCNKLYLTKAILNLHMTVHGERDHVCETCGKGFTRKQYLEVHWRSHTGENPFTCLVCGKAFRQYSHLQKHKWIHTGEKPYRCSLCGAAFGYKEALYKHNLIHTGGKPNVCKKCGRECTSQKDYRIHMRAHREQAGESIDPPIRLYKKQKPAPVRLHQPAPLPLQSAHLQQSTHLQQPAHLQQPLHVQQPAHQPAHLPAHQPAHRHQSLQQQLIPVQAHTSHLVQGPPPPMTYLGLEHIYLC